MENIGHHRRPTGEQSLFLLHPQGGYRNFQKRNQKKAVGKMTIEHTTTIKIMQLSDRVLKIIEDKDKLTQSDLQASIEAVIMEAMQEETKLNGKQGKN